MIIWIVFPWKKSILTKLSCDIVVKTVPSCEPPTKSPTLALLAVPIPSSSGKPLGVLEVLNKKRKTPSGQGTEQ